MTVSRVRRRPLLRLAQLKRIETYYTHILVILHPSMHRTVLFGLTRRQASEYKSRQYPTVSRAFNLARLYKKRWVHQSGVITPPASALI
jgi:hypothetical protein